ncbi:methylmalonyl-CoA mutase family protein [Arcicella sp. LKC2W]|uniref:methylmalonyl-CoA mutase family protein n=1 Tax=Arcicella sp. LKC2W TaxID=2984198 RepID=UPI002B21680F|nr:methylmalonyl-CoA mutase family protein [Arcicella sp. LKC2W]MEA5460563.1 methylmalonyl-CoA mutase family protein [Arcicella sp. LKC2W]
MKNQLFQHFVNHSQEQWKLQVIKDLKGKDFDKTLTWQIDTKIKISSYADSQNIKNLPLKIVQQSQFQGFTKIWSNREIIKFKSEKETNQLIINYLGAGANSFLIDFSGVLISEIEIKKLLSNIKLSDTPFFFKVENNGLKLVNELQTIAPYLWKGGIINDILERYFTQGILTDEDWKIQAEILRKVQNQPHFKSLIISSHSFHHAGANIAQEIAYTLASAIEVIDKISEQNIDLQEIVQKIEFSISVGTNYFGEIAKIRALKFLWKKILTEGYGLSDEKKSGISLHCETSSFYNSSITPNTNMLRATTEAMSAIIGGCDALSIRAYDESYQETDDFSRRIARNISTILKEESYFDKVVDPSAGSYFIESLTFQLAEEAFNILKTVENEGGIIAAFQKNSIQNSIKKNFEYLQDSLTENQSVMVGVNKFRFDEKPFEQKESIIKEPTDGSVELLPNRRLSEIFEK